jgi:hypothetical protein
LSKAGLISRAMMSEPPPGARGTMILTGLFGNSWARASPPNAAARMSAAAAIA